jgi:hypothetical protein
MLCLIRIADCTSFVVLRPPNVQLGVIGAEVLAKAGL